MRAGTPVHVTLEGTLLRVGAGVLELAGLAAGAHTLRTAGAVRIAWSPPDT